MKKQLTAIIMVLFVGICSMQAQSVVGKWKTIDDATKKAKSIVEITEVNGKLQGKIIEILNPERKNATCDKCSGSEKGKKIEGLVIIKDMKKDGDSYSGGTITDPEKGKAYSCIIKINDKNKDVLDVRGYVGISFAGRTQTWTRVK